MSRTIRVDFNWQKHRKGQGHSYREVRAEILRREKGEYRLTRDERIDARATAITKASMRFIISGVLLDTLNGLELTPGELLELVGCEEDDSADTLLTRLLDPVPRREDKPIECNSEMDALYPGEHGKKGE